MSVLLQPPAATPTPSVPLRKRTSSFSYPVDQPSPSPRPPKSPRMGSSSLRRAETFLLLSDAPPTTAPSPSPSTTQAQTTAPTQGPLPYYRTLAYQKDQRMKRKGMFLNSRPQHQPQQHQPALVQTPHQAVRHSLSSAQQQQQRVSAPAAARSNSGTSAIATSSTSTTAISSTATSSSGLRPLLLSAAASTSNATSNSGHRRGPSYPPSTSSSTTPYTSYTPKRPRPTPQPRAPTQVILPSISSPNPRTTIITHRTSSPLSPTPHAPLLSSSSSNINVINAARPRPRGKHEPDLLRAAIKIRMASTPEGQRILRLGPRLALMDWEMEVAAEGMCRVDDRALGDEQSTDGKTGGSESKDEDDGVKKVDVNGLSKAGTRWGILEVTRDLERLVADEEMRERMMMDEVEEMMDMALDGDGDVVMGDATVTSTAASTTAVDPTALDTTTAVEPTSAGTLSPATPTPSSTPSTSTTTTTPIPTPTSALSPTPTSTSTRTTPTPTPTPTTTPTPRVRLPLKRTTSMAVLPPMTMTMSTNTPVLTASWVVVRSSEADWEMVDCAA
ncbi:unnamed protein product [Cyclocybe aegerita]|uniref:Uncharacterized protein n=1 Tax=Cyclocybe aegerita TaxID=1973307 RepID=A0A8S0WVJ0_CYCAE|nr:unnamed protein product [Cyclocybe aegerita]